MMKMKQKPVKKSGKGMIPAGYANGGMVQPTLPMQANAGGAARGVARAAQMSGRAFADGGMVCGKTSSLNGKNMKK